MVGHLPEQFFIFVFYGFKILFNQENAISPGFPFFQRQIVRRTAILLQRVKGFAMV